MAYQHRENSGSLFVNDRREKDTHPHARGSAVIGGVEYWVSAWTKQTDDGIRWQSLAFQPKETQGETVDQKASSPNVPAGLNDDIPF